MSSKECSNTWCSSKRAHAILNQYSHVAANAVTSCFSQCHWPSICMHASRDISVPDHMEAAYLCAHAIHSKLPPTRTAAAAARNRCALDYEHRRLCGGPLMSRIAHALITFVQHLSAVLFNVPCWFLQEQRRPVIWACFWRPIVNRGSHGCALRL